MFDLRRQSGSASPPGPAKAAPVGEDAALPPDRSHELADRSYRMTRYAWFRIRGRVRELAAPHYLGHGFAYSSRYNIRNVWQAPMQDHVVVKICLSPGGVVAANSDAQPRRVRRGEVILRFVEEPEFWEAYDRRQRRSWEFLGLILNGAAAASTARGLINEFGRVYDLGVSHRLVRRLAELAAAPTHVVEMSGVEAMTLANSIFTSLYEAADGTASRVKSFELADAAEATIREDLARDWSVRELADRLDVSREHLTRVFAERHGVPPHRFLVELRIQEACKRLRGSNEPVKVILRDLGFKSHTSFSRTFQRYHHLTPSEYRTAQG